MQIEDAKKIKIISFVAAVTLALSLSSLMLAVSSLKKTTLSKSSQVPENIGRNTVPGIQIDENAAKATGFVGLPTGEAKYETENNLKKFELRGHWSLKEKPAFDYAGKEENTKLAIIVNENTKIFKVVAPAEKGQESTTQEISFQDFQIESQNNPYVVTFDEPTSTAFQMTLAEEIRILSLEIK